MGSHVFLGASRHADLEGGARDVLLAPLHHQDVVAPLLQHVADVVLQVAQVLDQDLLAGGLGAQHAHQQHVLPWGGNASVVRRVSKKKRTGTFKVKASLGFFGF